MTVSKDWVSQVARLLDEVAPAKPAAAAEELKAFQAFLWGTDDVGPVLDQSPRARAHRAVLRIARQYPWGPSELRRWLDHFYVATLEQLSDADLDQLNEHMLRLDDCARMGGVDPDGPGAW